MTNVINIKNAPEDWRDDSRYAYIGRGSLFGNPYPVARLGRERSLALYREYFERQIAIDPSFLLAVAGLRNKTLVCYCDPLPCHGDIIADFIERHFR